MFIFIPTQSVYFYSCLEILLIIYNIFLIIENSMKIVNLISIILKVYVLQIILFLCRLLLNRKE